jgi:hypothetical protein
MSSYASGAGGVATSTHRRDAIGPRVGSLACRLHLVAGQEDAMIAALEVGTACGLTITLVTAAIVLATLFHAVDA